MANVTVYQLPVEHKGCFRSWDENKGSFKLSDYREVWSGSLEDYRDPEDVYVLLNSEHRPVGYEGRSLSVSDVVYVHELTYVHGTEVVKSGLYFCDTIGFHEIEDYAKAFELYENFVYNEYGDYSFMDLDDLQEVGLMYSDCDYEGIDDDSYDGDYPVQVYADLVNLKLTYYVEDQLCYTEDGYNSATELMESNCNFDGLYFEACKFVDYHVETLKKNKSK